MSDKPKRIYYKDFMTGKRRWTAGTFFEWQRGGILNAWGAVVTTRATVLFIPHYLIEYDSLQNLPPLRPPNYDKVRNMLKVGSGWRIGDCGTPIEIRAVVDRNWIVWRYQGPHEDNSDYRILPVHDFWLMNEKGVLVKEEEES